MIPQSNFMIVVPVIASQRDALNAALLSMNELQGRVDPQNTIIPFGQFKQLHSARFVIVEANTGDEIKAFGLQPHDWPPSLAFLGDVDGDSSDFLAELAIVSSAGLNLIYGHCQGFVDHKGPLLNFLLRHRTDSAASYVNWIGRTVQQIHEESQLHHFLASRMESLLKKDSPLTMRSIRQSLLTDLQLAQHTGELCLTPEERTPVREHLRRLIDLLVIPLLLVLLLPVLIIVVPLIFCYLRIVERHDPDIDVRPTQEHINSLSEIEDHDVTNQFNVFGDIKPGRFRYWLLKVVMGAVNYSARNLYRRGYLARVRTIHFARWVFMNDRKSMFFASTYDGSLESYMDDFINKVAFGLNLTFSHGVGYPRTSWMLKGGAELEQPFKDTLRRHQLPSSVWYQAYPGLTAFDLARHSRIRRALEEYPRTDDAIRQWLQEI